MGHLFEREKQLDLMGVLDACSSHNISTFGIFKKCGVKARMRLKGMQVSDDKTKISTGWNIADLNTY